MLHFCEVVLQISVSVILFTNKVYILQGKKVAWLIGMIGTILAMAYLYIIHLYVFTVLEIGLIVLMAYGFFQKEEKNLTVEKFINIIIILSAVAMAWFVFTGIMTIFELVGSMGLLIGTYCLTHNKQKIGWLCYLVAHLFTAHLGYDRHQYFFADFQIASAIISFIGFKEYFRK